MRAGVHQHQAVGADQHADVRAGAGDHVEVRADALHVERLRLFLPERAERHKQDGHASREWIRHFSRNKHRIH